MVAEAAAKGEGLKPWRSLRRPSMLRASAVAETGSLGTMRGRSFARGAFPSLEHVTLGWGGRLRGALSGRLELAPERFGVRLHVAGHARQFGPGCDIV